MDVAAEAEIRCVNSAVRGLWALANTPVECTDATQRGGLGASRRCSRRSVGDVGWIFLGILIFLRYLMDEPEPKWVKQFSTPYIVAVLMVVAGVGIVLAARAVIFQLGQCRQPFYLTWVKVLTCRKLIIHPLSSGRILWQMYILSRGRKDGPMEALFRITSSKIMLTACWLPSKHSMKRSHGQSSKAIIRSSPVSGM